MSVREGPRECKGRIGREWALVSEFAVSDDAASGDWEESERDVRRYTPRKVVAIYTSEMSSLAVRETSCDVTKAGTDRGGGRSDGTYAKGEIDKLRKGDIAEFLVQHG